MGISVGIRTGEDADLLDVAAVAKLVRTRCGSGSEIDVVQKVERLKLMWQRSKEDRHC